MPVGCGSERRSLICRVWERIPALLRHSGCGSTSVCGVEIANILKQQQIFQEQIFYLSSRATPENRLLALQQNLRQASRTIEQLCAERQATPATLKAPSRRAYAWMKFLTQPTYLPKHLRAVGQLRQELTARAPQQRAYIELTNMRGLYRGRIQARSLSLKLHEGFLAASDPLLAATIARIIGQEKDAAALRQFALSEAYADIVRELDCLADRGADRIVGRHYDLLDSFARVNRDCFDDRLSPPRLSWGSRPSRRKLGHYESASDRIVISPVLDDPQVPPLALEFVLYHELLHRQLGCQLHNGKVRVHTPEFRQRERAFPAYREAQQWLSWVASR